jgi:NDP-sugar pyrophosphorylase family protein
LPVAVLAGGLATRLKPVTDKIPKSLIEIAGRPFIFHQLELLKRQGVDTVVVCAGHLGDQIEGAVGDGRSMGLSISYSHEGEKLLGTGGALKRALPLLGSEFFVLYGDSYLTCSYVEVQAAYRAAGVPALMTVFRNEGRWDVSNAAFRDDHRLVYDKMTPSSAMTHIDYGLGVLSVDVLAKYAGGQVIDLADIYHELSLGGRLGGFEVAERFYEIGSLQGIADAEKFLSSRNVKS